MNISLVTRLSFSSASDDDDDDAIRKRIFSVGDDDDLGIKLWFWMLGIEIVKASDTDAPVSKDTDTDNVEGEENFIFVVSSIYKDMEMIPFLLLQLLLSIRCVGQS